MAVVSFYGETFSENEHKLSSCPFCGGKAHFRYKTKLRVNEDIPPAIRTAPDFGWGEHDYVENVYDRRYGIQVWCGRCKTKTPYVWGDWHIPTQDEIDEGKHGTELFNLSEELEALNKCIGLWNRRAGAWAS